MSYRQDADTLRRELTAVYTAAVYRAGGVIAVREGKTERSDKHLYLADLRDVVDADGRTHTLALLRLTAWIRYTSAQTYARDYAYLCGHLDGRVWVERVPGRLTSAARAAEWAVPAAVRHAVEAGHPVRRVGGYYVLTCRNGQCGMSRTTAKIDGVEWDQKTRTLTVAGYPRVQITEPSRIVPRRSIAM